MLEQYPYISVKPFGSSVSEEKVVELYNKLLQKLLSSLDANDFEHVLRIILGIYLSSRTGLTPAESQLSQLYLYIKTNGLLQELLIEADPNCIIQLLHSRDLTNSFIRTPGSSVEQLFSILSTNGYLVLPDALNDALIRDLRDISHACSLWTVNYADGNTSSEPLFPSQSWPNNAVRLLAELPLDSPPILQLAEDPKLNYIVARYLDGKYYLRYAGISISRPGSKYSVAEAAQQFHFDIDSNKWLKIFVYLTDVDDSNGPHTAVYRTHKPGSKSPELLKRGYARISDIDIHQYHPEFITRITGDAGTIIIGDTRCFHKGTPVIDGLREMLVLQFSNSRFGNQLTTK